MYRLIFSWNVRNNNIVVVYISTGYKYKNIFPNYFWLKKTLFSGWDTGVMCVSTGVENRSSIGRLRVRIYNII